MPRPLVILLQILLIFRPIIYFISFLMFLDNIFRPSGDLFTFQIMVLFDARLEQLLLVLQELDNVIIAWVTAVLDILVSEFIHFSIYHPQLTLLLHKVAVSLVNLLDLRDHNLTQILIVVVYTVMYIIRWIYDHLIWLVIIILIIESEGIDLPISLVAYSKGKILLYWILIHWDWGLDLLSHITFLIGSLVRYLELRVDWSILPRYFYFFNILLVKACLVFLNIN